MKNSEIDKVDMIASVSRSLWGRITPNVRGIVFAYDSDKQVGILRSYLDQPPTPDDLEEINMACTEVLCDFPQLRDFKPEARFSDEPINQLEPLSGYIFLRKEE